jgi:hypothetical protein
VWGDQGWRIFFFKYIYIYPTRLTSSSSQSSLPSTAKDEDASCRTNTGRRNNIKEQVRHSIARLAATLEARVTGSTDGDRDNDIYDSMNERRVVQIHK